ncbi:MAG: AraC family transcriptional regulator [Alteromonadaceae bacterium]|nr:MAG: AraC family transcriptional regulator [Alteromonadaceae bacterium]
MTIAESEPFNESNDGVVTTVPIFNQMSFDGSEQCLRHLYRVVTGGHLMASSGEALGLLLEVGRAWFNADFALLTKPVSETVFEVQACAGREDRFYIGQHLSTSKTLCYQARSQEEVRVISNVRDEGLIVMPSAYAGVEVASYIGKSVITPDGSCHVLCFFSSRALTRSFNEDDHMVVDDLVRGTSCLLDQQNSSSHRKQVDATMMASGFVQTLDDYIVQGQLPELYGIPGRVVEVLDSRIGQTDLSIGRVSESMKLSKRTLQRRLQQQNVNFAELRDQVRFHHAIRMLVEGNVSIDSISSALDFSDRTSFTNAFKRWTGLSPSAFRRKFRDL